MKNIAQTRLFDHLTYKGNLKHTRYGWLRLTPAHSVHLISDLLERHLEDKPIVLDPFCGTGTTALVCAERGIHSATTDINPFLIWLTRAKSHVYTNEEVAAFQKAGLRVMSVMAEDTTAVEWTPPLHQIEKWWDEQTLHALSRAICLIKSMEQTSPQPVTDLLKVAFCRTMIERANVSFAHQSMSFKKQVDTAFCLLEYETAHSWEQSVSEISQAACSEVITQPEALLCDARNLTDKLTHDYFSCVITSPPYPNRMSYIRELRPYMYWLGYLENGRDAGELDWKAIGGTWGCATSNVGKWNPTEQREIPYQGFAEVVERIGEKSPLLARYVHKYFYDMVAHTKELFAVVRSGGRIHYIVGNSKFYDVMLPVERIFETLFKSAGFENIAVCAIRKRTSKKELFEFVVSAQKP